MVVSVVVVVVPKVLAATVGLAVVEAGDLSLNQVPEASSQEHSKEEMEPLARAPIPAVAAAARPPVRIFSSI
jgi:hypothetical protein